MIISYLSSLTTCVSTSLRALIRHLPLSEREDINFRGIVDQIGNKKENDVAGLFLPKRHVKMRDSFVNIRETNAKYLWRYLIKDV